MTEQGKTGKPIILRFEIPPNRFFIYDALTNMFFEVDNVIYDILEHYKILSDDEIIKKLGEKYSPQELEKSFKIITEQEEKQGLFSEKRLSGMSYYHSEEHSFYDGYKDKCNQLILEITQRCNFRCKYCVYSGLYAYQRMHDTAEMTWETAKAAVDWFIEASKYQDDRAITFYGGEPLLKFDLIKKVIEYVKQKGWKASYSFTTNASLLSNLETVDYLAKNNVGLLISLDGPPEVHDKYRVFADGEPSHAFIMKNLRKIHELYPEYYSTSVNCTATIAYNSDFPKVYDFFKKDHGFPLRLQGASQVDAADTDFYKVYGENKADEENTYSLLFNKYCNMLTKKTPEDPEIKDDSSKILNALFDSNFIYIHRRCMKKHNKMHMNGCCVPGQRRVFVEVNGNMHPCEKVGNKYPLGNVNEGGFDMNNVKSFLETYVNLSVDDCRECPAQNLCQLCFRAAMKSGIMTHDRKKESCELYLKSFKQNLYNYILIKSKNKDAFKFIDEMEVS